MREYLLVFLIAASGTYLLSGIARKVAVRTGAMAKVRERDVHATPTPYLGGVAMLCGVAAAFLVASQLPFLGRLPVVTRDSFGIFLASAVICGVGALDDLLDLSAIAKIAGQVLAAGVAVVNGVRWYWISLPNQIVALDTATSVVVTVLFIFVCVNAINLVDGLDGLAAGMVGIGAMALFSFTYLLAFEERFTVATTASLVAITVAGVCVGFLPHNFYPARMFMGDSGAMLLGLLLACSTISFTGQIDSSAIGVDGAGALYVWMPLILPFAIMAIPFLDLILAYVRRTMKGNWWYVADKQHLHHRLLQRGHNQVTAALVMYLWTAVISFGSILIGLHQTWWSVLLLILGCVLASWLTVKPDYLTKYAYGNRTPL